MDITFSGEYNGGEFEVTRIFRNRTVEHHLLTVPDDIQGKGMAKDILRTFYKQYQKANIETIEIYANINVGGYAWGKYGFQADVSDVKIILDRYTRNYGEFADEANEIFEEWLRFNADEAYFPMHLLADTDFGKDLLLDTNWNGILNLKDKQQVKRFEDYLNKSKKK